MKDLYRGYLSLDGGVLIALAVGEKGLGDLVSSLISEEAYGLTHEIAVSELLYILCRKASYEIAQRKLDALKSSGYIEIVPISDLIENASKLKCDRHIALADCFTIALAEEFNGKAVFAKLEKELIKAVEKSPFDVDLIFAFDRKYVRKGKTDLESF